MKTLSIALVRTDSGSVDLDATLAGAKSAVLSHIAEAETQTAEIASAVSSVFDTLNGARANMPYVQSSAARLLNAQPENHKALTERVAQYVRDNASTDRADGKLFSIQKGKGGGVSRWSDVPEATESK